MRDLIVTSLEKLIDVIVILLGLAVVGFAVSATFGGPIAGLPGALAGLAILVGGGLSVILIGGFLYMSVGNYHHNWRTAVAVEKLAAR